MNEQERERAVARGLARGLRRAGLVADAERLDAQERLAQEADRVAGEAERTAEAERLRVAAVDRQAAADRAARAARIAAAGKPAPANRGKPASARPCKPAGAASVEELRASAATTDGKLRVALVELVALAAPQALRPAVAERLAARYGTTAALLAAVDALAVEARSNVTEGAQRALPTYGRGHLPEPSPELVTREAQRLLGAAVAREVEAAPTR